MNIMVLKSLLTLLAAISFAASPFFVTSFSGFDPDLYPIPQIDPPVQPAGYAFAIWGPIYILLILHAVLGLWGHARSPKWDRSRWPMIASLGIGTFWLAIANASPIWATVAIWAMLSLALAALFATPVRGGAWLLHGPIALYAGWLTAASSAGLGLVGAGYGLWFGQTGWAFIGLGIALTIAVAVQVRLGRAPEYGAAVVWAILAIAVKNWGVNMPVALVALVGAVLVALAAVAALRNAGRAAGQPRRA